MKTTILLTSITILTIVILAIGCKSESKKYDVELSLMTDITEPGFIAKPTAEDIKKYFSNRASIWNGKKFNLIPITDVDINYTYSADLPSENVLVGNSYKRKKLEAEFFEEIEANFEKINAIPIGKTNSSIYIPIVNELNRLVKSSSTEKILLIYSDLEEHSSLANFYNTSEIEKMVLAPDSIITLWEQNAVLPNLSGIHIKIIYEPRNPIDNKKFRTLLLFYKKLFESKGAEVSISAN